MGSFCVYPPPSCWQNRPAALDAWGIPTLAYSAQTGQNSQDQPHRQRMDGRNIEECMWWFAKAYERNQLTSSKHGDLNDFYLPDMTPLPSAPAIAGTQFDGWFLPDLDWWQEYWSNLVLLHNAVDGTSTSWDMDHYKNRWYNTTKEPVVSPANYYNTFGKFFQNFRWRAMFDFRMHTATDAFRSSYWRINTSTPANQNWSWFNSQSPIAAGVFSTPRIGYTSNATGGPVDYRFRTLYANVVNGNTFRQQYGWWADGKDPVLRTKISGSVLSHTYDVRFAFIETDSSFLSPGSLVTLPVISAATTIATLSTTEQEIDISAFLDVEPPDPAPGKIMNWVLFVSPQIGGSDVRSAMEGITSMESTDTPASYAKHYPMSTTAFVGGTFMVEPFRVCVDDFLMIPNAT